LKRVQENLFGFRVLKERDALFTSSVRGQL
jgi:hypothetical protein